MSETTAIALKSDAPVQKSSKSITFTPTNFAEAVTFAKMLSTSELVPKDYRGKHTNILVAMQMGAEVGLSPMAALQSIAVINGKPSLYGDAALAVVQSHPSYESHREWVEGEGDKKTAYCEIKRRGQQASHGKFSIQDAKIAGLFGKEGPWRTYPERMLQMRARGFALRDRFADALRGMILVEEAADMPQNVPPTGVERATLEPMTTAQALGTMSVSTEPNRGHGNEGTSRQAVPEKTMCADCRQIDSHAPDCPHAPTKGKASTKSTKSRREAWETQEGHDPKVHIPFDDGVMLFDLQRALKVTDDQLKGFLDREFEIQHRYLIRQDAFQTVLDAIQKEFGPKEEATEDPGPGEGGPLDGLFDEKK